MSAHRGIAGLLGSLSARGLVVVGVVLIVVGLLVADATRSRALVRLLGLVIGSGVVALGLGLYRGLVAKIGERRATIAAWIAAGVIVACGALWFLSYHYNDETERVCDRIEGGAYNDDSLAVRRQAIADYERRLGSPWSLLPRLLGDLPYGCTMALEDFARLDRGLCPQEPIDGVACRCGEQMWPEDTGCREKPSCPWRNPSREEGFNCWRDSL